MILSIERITKTLIRLRRLIGTFVVCKPWRQVFSRWGPYYITMASSFLQPLSWYVLVILPLHLRIHCVGMVSMSSISCDQWCPTLYIRGLILQPRSSSFECAPHKLGLQMPHSINSFIGQLLVYFVFAQLHWAVCDLHFWMPMQLRTGLDKQNISA